MKNPPDILVQKTPMGLMPYGNHSVIAIDEMVINQVMTAKRRRDRKLPVNGGYWAGLHNAVDNCEAWPTAAHLHSDLKRLCGYVESYHNPFTGQDEVRVQSTAFDKMDETEFRIYWRLAQLRFAQKMGFDPWARTTPDKEMVG